jgi:hypothetical protein
MVRLLAVLILALCIASPASAQLQASPLGSVSTLVDGTTIAVEYYRPAVRGRDLFGGIVPWGGVWTPGANWATVLRVDRDVRIQGVDVPAGEYSLWMIPREDRFTLSLNPEARIFHALKPDSSEAQIHVSAEPGRTAHTEMLTWRVPTQRGDLAVLEFAWGETAVQFEVLVQPTEPAEMSPERREMFVGTYTVNFNPAFGFPETAEFEVFEADGRLRGRLPFTVHPDDLPEWDLVPAGSTPETWSFNAGLYHEDGVLFNVELGVAIDFDIPADADRATAVRFSLPGMVYGEGTRSR